MQLRQNVLPLGKTRSIAPPFETCSRCKLQASRCGGVDGSTCHSTYYIGGGLSAVTLPGVLGTGVCSRIAWSSAEGRRLWAPVAV